MEVYTIFKIS